MVNFAKKDISKDQAEKIFDDLIEDFELDLLDGRPEELQNIKNHIVPAIRRCRIAIDTEEITISYKLKQPVKFISDTKENSQLSEIIFSADNCTIGSLKTFDKEVERGNMTKAIVHFASSRSSVITPKITEKFCSTDIAVCSGIAALFLVF